MVRVGKIFQGQLGYRLGWLRAGWFGLGLGSLGHVEPGSNPFLRLRKVHRQI